MRRRVASQTAAQVWSEKIGTSTSSPAAEIGASTGSQPPKRTRSITRRHSGRAAERNGATAMSPVGVAATANAAASSPSATGARRRVATPRSTAQKASRAAITTTGSGRSPLL